MEIVKALKQFQQKLDPLISDYLDKKSRQFKQMAPGSEILIEQIKDLTLRGGDRIRPALLFYGYTSVKPISNLQYLISDSKDREIFEVIKLSLALELFHTFALIHDDIMDKALTRRGGKTVHQVIGINQAILAGDLALVLADELWVESKLPITRLKRARVLFEQMRQEVIMGQSLDLNTQMITDVVAGLVPAREEEILRMYELKTARYGLSRPLEMGAVLAGLDRKTIKALFDFGLNIGIAFQLRDDWLGMFGEPKKTGKPVDSDLKEGKMTLLVFTALRKLKIKNKKPKTQIKNLKMNKLSEIWGNKHASKGDARWVRRLIRDSGAEEYCLDMARRLVEKGKKQLDNVKINSQTKEFLLALADFAVEREY